MDGPSNRRKLIATLTVALPVLAGVLIIALGHFLGHETDTAPAPAPTPSEPARRAGVAPAATGSPAPRIRLREGANGRRFDAADLEGAPYAVVFITTRCEAIGDFLGRAVAELDRDDAGADVLAISADPKVDTEGAVRAWLARHHLDGGPFHYLVGSEAEVRGLWRAWGFAGPASSCSGSVPAHLVGGSGTNSGVIDLDPRSPASILTDALVGAAK